MDPSDPSCRLGTASSIKLARQLLILILGSAFSSPFSPTALKKTWGLATGAKTKYGNTNKQQIHSCSPGLAHNPPHYPLWIWMVCGNFGSGIAKCLNCYVPWVYCGSCWIRSANHNKWSYIHGPDMSYYYLPEISRDNCHEEQLCTATRPPLQQCEHILLIRKVAVFFEQPARNYWADARWHHATKAYFMGYWSNQATRKADPEKTRWSNQPMQKWCKDVLPSERLQHSYSWRKSNGQNTSPFFNMECSIKMFAYDCPCYCFWTCCYLFWYSSAITHAILTLVLCDCAARGWSHHAKSVHSAIVDFECIYTKNNLRVSRQERNTLRVPQITICL